jgi:hypothetical protein
MNKPAADNRAYRIACNVYDEAGNMEDPDDNEVCVRVIQTVGTYVTATLYKEAALSTALDNPTDDTVFPNASGWRAMERDAAGRYFFFYKVASDATEEHLVVEFGWSESETSKFHVRSTEIADEHDDASDTLSAVTTINTNVGDPSGDTLTTVTAKLGNPTTAIGAVVETIDGYHDVPVEDAATDATIRDVVGKKSDTVAGTSLVSLVKIADAAVDVIDGLHDVPVEDAATDATMRDVIGKKSDTVAGTSIVALAKKIDAKTTNLPSDPADESAVEAAITASQGTVTGAITSAHSTSDALQNVPVEDAATDATIRDVVGKKTDTVAGTSIVSLVKIADAAVDVIDGLHDVPVEDAATDATIRDVVGKKSDTVAGTSIVASTKRLEALHTVPVEDAATDTNLRDVVGKKSDTTAGTSLVSLVKIADAAVDVIDGLHDVPVEDAATDATIRDVVGKKSDTVAGTSLVSLVKVADAAIDVIDGYHDVPVEDAATDATMRDVVGKKSDTVAGTSLVAINKQIKVQTDKINDQPVDAGDATHAITVAHDVNETQVVEVAKAGIYSLTLFFDLDVLVTAAEGTTVTVRMYNKIDGTNYSDKAFDKKVFTIASDTEYPFMEYHLLHGYSKVTIQLGSAVTETRTISYRSITRDLGA